MSIIDRVRSALAERARGSISGATQQVLPGLLGEVASGALVNGITMGPKGVAATVAGLKSAGTDLVIGEINRGINAAEAAAKRQAEQLARQAAGLSAASGPPTPIVANVDAPETSGSAVPWAPAPVFGGLSLRQYRKLWADSAMTPKAFKNLFHISIREMRPSREAPGGAGGFNLYALDVSFGPVTMPGEAVPIGSANMDNLTSAERVEVRITTMDDLRGSVKRWMIGKCDQAARIDGTFGLPVDYLLIMDVTHMAIEPTGDTDARLTHRWLVRPSGMENELSRRAPELEELQLSFVQFDTFLAPE